MLSRERNLFINFEGCSFISIFYRGFPYLSIYPKKKHAPKPQIRMIVRAPKQQIRMIIRVLDDSSIIRIICGPELKTRRNRNFPHIQRSFPRTFRCVSSEKSAPKSPFCVWLSSAFRWFLSGRKSRNPIDNTCPKMRNPIVWPCPNLWLVPELSSAT